MKLYDYYRSSAAYRVRIALAWKGVSFERVPVDLLKGEQRDDAYRALNPNARVPVLDDGARPLSQSVAILEYLEETHREPPLLPRDPVGRARVRELALGIACDLHPLQNIGVTNHLGKHYGVPEADQLRWRQHWIGVGFDALERRLAGESDTGRFCHGDAPTFADVCLVPQMYNARRYECPVDVWPTLCRIEAACLELEAFRASSPDASA